jgi:hypothetical protein
MTNQGRLLKELVFDLALCSPHPKPLSNGEGLKKDYFLYKLKSFSFGEGFRMRRKCAGERLSKRQRMTNDQ